MVAKVPPSIPREALAVPERLTNLPDPARRNETTSLAQPLGETSLLSAQTYRKLDSLATAMGVAWPLACYGESGNRTTQIVRDTGYRGAATPEQREVLLSPETLTLLNARVQLGNNARQLLELAQSLDDPTLLPLAEELASDLCSKGTYSGLLLQDLEGVRCGKTLQSEGRAYAFYQARHDQACYTLHGRRPAVTLPALSRLVGSLDDRTTRWEAGLARAAAGSRAAQAGASSKGAAATSLARFVSRAEAVDALRKAASGEGERPFGKGKFSFAELENALLGPRAELEGLKRAALRAQELGSLAPQVEAALQAVVAGATRLEEELTPLLVEAARNDKGFRIRGLGSEKHVHARDATLAARLFGERRSVLAMADLPGHLFQPGDELNKRLQVHLAAPLAELHEALALSDQATALPAASDDVSSLLAQSDAELELASNVTRLSRVMERASTMAPDARFGAFAARLRAIPGDAQETLTEHAQLAPFDVEGARALLRETTGDFEALLLAIEKRCPEVLTEQHTNSLLLRSIARVPGDDKLDLETPAEEVVDWSRGRG